MRRLGHEADSFACPVRGAVRDAGTEYATARDFPEVQVAYEVRFLTSGSLRP